MGDTGGDTGPETLNTVSTFRSYLGSQVELTVSGE